MHLEYSLEGKVLKQLSDVTDFPLQEFLVMIVNHIEKWSKLLEQVIRQLT